MAITYPVFSSIGGPQVDVQLFPQAAEAGANLAKSIPSPFTSIIQGAEEGYKTFQNFDLTQAQIQNEQALAQQNQAKAQIDQINAEAAQANEQTTLEASQIEAQNNLMTAQKANKLLKQGQEVSRILTDGTDEEKKSLFSSAYSDYWAQNPKDEASVIRDNWGLFDDAQKPIMASRVYTGEQMRYMAELQKGSPQAAELQKEYNTAMADPNVASIGTTASAILGHNVSQVEQFSYNLVPSNLYEKDPDDPTKLKFDTKGNPILSKTANNVVPKEAANYNLIDATGRIVGNLNYESATKYGEAQNAARSLGVGLPLPQSIRGPVSPEANFVGQTSSVPLFNNPVSTNGFIPQRGTAISEPSLANAQAAGIIPRREAPTANIVPQGSTSKIDNAAAIDLNKKLAGAPPDVTAKVQDILASKQGINTQAQTGTPAAIATPTPSSTPVQRSLGSIISDFLVPKAHADELAITGSTPPDPNPKVVSKVKSNELLKDETPLVQAMAAVESQSNPKAISPTGVKGILQVTKPVATSYGLNRNVPAQNLLAGKLYMRDLIDQFKDLQLALAAYNGGPGRLGEAINLVGSTDFKDVAEGLRFMVSQGKLTQSKFNEIVKYPGQVINYLKAFNGR